MNVVHIINEALSSKRTRFAFELLPPLKGDGMQKIFGAIDPLVPFDPAYINITFHREGIKETELPDGGIEWHVVRRRPGTVGISAAIRQRYGIEVVPHLICGGLSKYDIEDTLIDMDFLGLHNVLALRGDKSQNERRFMPHPQGHAHAVDLVRQIAAMNLMRTLRPIPRAANPKNRAHRVRRMLRSPLFVGMMLYLLVRAVWPLVVE